MTRLLLAALCLLLLGWNSILRTENRTAAKLLIEDATLLRSFARTDTLVLSMHERSILLDGCARNEWVARKDLLGEAYARGER